jgi:hypothetical protein
MEFFDAPLALKDHAPRACHAALAIQQTGAEYGAKIVQEFSPAR